MYIRLLPRKWLSCQYFQVDQEVSLDAAEPPVDAQDIPEYDGPYDGKVPDDFEIEKHLPSRPNHPHNPRPRKKRSCSPARRTAPAPRTIPR